jgi:O-antigen/teichoic acid export membrane protein
MAQLFVYTFALNLMMRTDLFLLKRIAATMVDGSADYRATFASTTASFYGTAQSLAFIPYQGILALAFVIFPLISRATFEQDIAATRAYIEQTCA